MTDETPAARVAAPLSEERIAELRDFASDETTFFVEPKYLTECLDEISRLRAVIAERDAIIADRELEIERLGGWITYMLDADDATIILAGEAVPE